uniref:MAX dimerization protein 1 n=1 Tax=Serinus canaria TaxID=9135 RepID=A0A8C9NRB8_SERCA
MDTGKLGSAGSTGKLGSAALFSRKRDFLKELEFPSCINLLEQRKPRCHRKREDSWRTASAPAGIWGFCVQNHPVPTKNKERKHSQGISVCSPCRRAQLRLCLERLKGLVPLGAAAGRHTTLSLLTRARLHIQKLEDQERRALHQIEQLQREQRHLQRQLEKLGMERVRIDSIGSSLSSEQEMDVDVESTDDLPADLDWSSSSPSDSDERGSLQSLGSDEGYSSSGGTRLSFVGPWDA